jgi:hypothetical protein
MLDLALTLLPHAAAPFALWVKVDGKQPALARGAASAPAGAPPAAPRPRTGAAPAPPAPTARLKTAVLEMGTDPAAAAEPSRGPAPSEPDGGRRDTPTEMYVKGVHGGVSIPDGDDAPAATGDRDTPTRAMDLASLPGSPSGPSLGNAQDDVPDVPTVDMRGASAQLLRQGGHAGEAPPAAPSFGGGMLQPGSATAKLTMPLSAMVAVPPDGPPEAAPLDASATPPQKPKWQLVLDNALLTTGRFGDRQYLRFRAAPQNTQIIVVIVAGTVTILVLGFVLFLAMH